MFNSDDTIRLNNLQFNEQTFDSFYTYEVKNNRWVNNLKYKITNLEFIRCTFNDGNFEEFKIKDRLSFKNVTLFERTSFGRDSMEQLVLNHVNNKELINVDNAFLRDMTLGNSILGSVDIKDATIKYLNIYETRLKYLTCSNLNSGRLYILGSTIENDVDLLYDKPVKKMEVGSCRFNDRFILKRSNVENIECRMDTFKALNFFKDTLQDVSFSNCKFDSILSLRDLDFSPNSNIDFIYSYLPNVIDFSFNDKIFTEIDFNGANFENHYYPGTKIYKKHLIYLYKTDISKIKLDYRFFELLFIDPENPHKELTDDDKESIYEMLLKNFKDRGLNESYQLLDIEYQNFKLRNFKFVSFVIKYWWNYGYDKYYVFFWTAGFLLLFTTINFFLLRYLNQEVYRVPNIAVPSKKEISRRLWYSFIYSSAIFFKLTLKTENINFKKKRGSFYIILIYTVGIICLAYIANFVIQK